MTFALTLTMTLFEFAEEFSEDFPGGCPGDALAAEIKHQPRKSPLNRACVVCGWLFPWPLSIVLRY